MISQRATVLSYGEKIYTNVFKSFPSFMKGVLLLFHVSLSDTFWSDFTSQQGKEF